MLNKLRSLSLELGSLMGEAIGKSLEDQFSRLAHGAARAEAERSLRLHSVFGVWCWARTVPQDDRGQPLLDVPGRNVLFGATSSVLPGHSEPLALEAYTSVEIKEVFCLAPTGLAISKAVFGADNLLGSAGLLPFNQEVLRLMLARKLLPIAVPIRFQVQSL